MNMASLFPSKYLIACHSSWYMPVIPALGRLRQYKSEVSLSYIVRPCLKIYIYGWAPVAHAYNPNYSGGRDQEDHDLKPKQTFWETLSQKYPSQKWLVEWLKVKALSSSPSTTHTHTQNGWVPVVHTCNPSCLGGRDQEYWGSKPAQANSSWDSI
jgi:hypothetical protein